MKKGIIFFYLVFMVIIVYSQKECNCEQTTDLLIQTMEKAYPGFTEKTSDKVLYNNYKQNITQKAANSDNTHCIKILKEYLAFFKDKHISINNLKNIDETTLQSKTIKIDDLKSIRKSNNKTVGVWRISKSNNDVGIIKSDTNSYIGFLIKNNDSINKKEYPIVFELFSDKTATLFGNKIIKTNYRIYKNSILTFHFNSLPLILTKKEPLPDLTNIEIKEKIKELYEFHIKQLSKETVYLRLPSFGYENVNEINELIENNKTLLESSKNLIIDVRGNKGGTDMAYIKLLPYVVTGSIRVNGVEYLATQNLIDELQKFLNENIDIDKKDRENFEREIKLYKNSLGHFVNTYKTEIEIIEIEPANKSPKQIVIIVDENVASSAENFVFKARQSKKVKIIGTPTGGVMDYGAVRPYKFECKNYQLNLPTFRSLRLPDYPIDNIGLQPDIYLDKSVENWIEFAKEYIEN